MTQKVMKKITTFFYPKYAIIPLKYLKDKTSYFRIFSPPHQLFNSDVDRFLIGLTTFHSTSDIYQNTNSKCNFLKELKLDLLSSYLA